MSTTAPLWYLHQIEMVRKYHSWMLWMWLPEEQKKSKFDEPVPVESWGRPIDSDYQYIPISLNLSTRGAISSTGKRAPLVARMMFNQEFHLICPECRVRNCKGMNTHAIPHRTNKRIHKTHKIPLIDTKTWTTSFIDAGPFTEIAKPEFDEAYIYKDYHHDLICSHCGLIIEHLKTYIDSENKQKPDNADFAGDDDEGYTFGPIYFGDKENGDTLDPDYTPYLNQNPSVKRGPDVMLHYCTETGRSFYARPLIRTDPDWPNQHEERQSKGTSGPPPKIEKGHDSPSCPGAVRRPRSQLRGGVDG